MTSRGEKQQLLQFTEQQQLLTQYSYSVLLARHIPSRPTHIPIPMENSTAAPQSEDDSSSVEEEVSALHDIPQLAVAAAAFRLLLDASWLSRPPNQLPRA